MASGVARKKTRTTLQAPVVACLLAAIVGAACKSDPAKKEWTTICNAPALTGQVIDGLDPPQQMRFMWEKLHETLGDDVLDKRVTYVASASVAVPEKIRRLRADSAAAGVSPCAWADWMEAHLRP